MDFSQKQHDALNMKIILPPWTEGTHPVSSDPSANERFVRTYEKALMDHEGGN